MKKETEEDEGRVEHALKFLLLAFGGLGVITVLGIVVAWIVKMS